MKSYANGLWRPCSRIEAERRVTATAFGRGVFTTLGVSGGRPWFLQEHLQRLQCEAGKLGLDPEGRLPARWRRLVGEGLRTNRMSRGVIRLGFGPSERETRVFALFERVRRTPREIVLQIVEVDAPPHGCYVKSLQGVSWGSYRNQAESCGCFDVLIVRRGRLTESSRFNLFLELDGSLVTPPDGEVFPGIARKVILEHSELTALVRTLNRMDLVAARRVFLTNSVRGVLPVTRVLDSIGRTVWRSRERSAAPLSERFFAAASRSL